MHRSIPPAIKGLISAVLMIAIVFVIYYAGDSADPRIQYLIYAIYAAGVVWTLIAYRHSTSFTGTFGGLFNQGFRCFIVVTLIMVAFTGIFSKMHPEFAEESAKAYKEQLIAKKDKQLPEIESEVATYKKQYTLRLVSISIFGYLIIGAGVGAVTSALLTRRK